MSKYKKILLAVAKGGMSQSEIAAALQAFCEMFADEAERMGATRHFEHEPGAKCYIDWRLPVSNGNRQSNSPRSPGMNSLVTATSCSSHHLA